MPILAIFTVCTRYTKKASIKCRRRFRPYQSSSFFFRAVLPVPDSSGKNLKAFSAPPLYLEGRRRGFCHQCSRRWRRPSSNWRSIHGGLVAQTGKPLHVQLAVTAALEYSAGPCGERGLESHASPRTSPTTRNHVRVPIPLSASSPCELHILTAMVQDRNELNR